MEFCFLSIIMFLGLIHAKKGSENDSQDIEERKITDMKKVVQDLIKKKWELENNLQKIKNQNEMQMKTYKRSKTWGADPIQDRKFMITLKTESDNHTKEINEDIAQVQKEVENQMKKINRQEHILKGIKREKRTERNDLEKNFILRRKNFISNNPNQSIFPEIKSGSQNETERNLLFTHNRS